jgi:hypothetical protein
MRLAFDGRATRNFLLLLCMMEFVLFIDRVNLAAAAPVMQKDLGLSNISSWAAAGLPTGLVPGVRSRSAGRPGQSRPL